MGKLHFCEDCVLKKATRVSFKTTLHNIKQTLDYTHLDLWGLSKITSYGGVRYFLSIIDDSYRKVWIYILKNKSDTFSKFKNWKTLVETQVGRKVKRLGTDNGLEYLSTEFNNFCHNEGIFRHKTM